MVAWSHGLTNAKKSDAPPVGSAAPAAPKELKLRRGSVTETKLYCSEFTSARELEEALKQLEQCKAEAKHEFTAAVVDALRVWLAGAGERMVEHFRQWDKDGSCHWSEREVQRALEALDLKLPIEVVRTIFDEIDADGNYRVDFSELNQWVEEHTAADGQIGPQDENT